MTCDPNGPHGLGVALKKWSPQATLLLLASTISSATANAQTAKAAAPLVFDSVTVIDVEQGKPVPDQRVVIEGNHIQAVGNIGSVSLPKGAQVVSAKGKYLIPGLWDMHIHPGLLGLAQPDVAVNQPPTDATLMQLLAFGVTGFRDAWTSVPLDTLVQWHREVLAGTRDGPPREMFSGVAINSGESCDWDASNLTGHIQIASGDSACMFNLVDALKKAGATWLKTYNLQESDYFLLARAARHYGMHFGGHAPNVNPLDAADSGATSLDHVGPEHVGEMDAMCFAADQATVADCQKVADKFKKTNTWSMPTLSSRGIRWFRNASPKILTNLMMEAIDSFWTNFKYNPNWLQGHEVMPVPANPDTLNFGYLKIPSEVGLPMLTGGDTGWPDAGFKTHADMAIMVDRGTTILQALQAATINPAKAIGATDSMGTVAAGKLADLVLLDANPLADITNTTQIRAVVANGRYYDRTALDGLLNKIKAAAQ